MIPMNGDHAEFEMEWEGRDPKERPDWPLPSFDAKDWAEAFCKTFMVSKIPEISPSYPTIEEAVAAFRARAGRTIEGEDDQVGLMITWFAGALMRGYDEARKQ